MKTHDMLPHRTTTRVLLLLTVAMVGGGSSGWTAPPQKRATPVARGLEKVGNFFFNFARKLEQSGFPEDDPSPRIIYEARPTDPVRSDTDPRSEPSTGLTLPPGYRDGDEYRNPPRSRTPARSQQLTPPQQKPKVEPFTPPNFQVHPQPRLHYPKAEPTAPRSSLSLPVPRPTSPTGEAAQPLSTVTPNTTGVPFDPPATPPVRTNPGAVQEEKPAAPAPPAQSAFATPVPGHKGFVYPPGVEQDMQNMLDVRGITPGQKVRDPRSGKVFLVPPN